MGWYDSVLVTKPDKTTEKLGPFTTDDTGGTYTPYTPTQMGNYSFQMSFPGQTLSGTNPPPGGYSAAIQAYVGDFYAASTQQYRYTYSATNTSRFYTAKSLSNTILDTTN